MPWPSSLIIVVGHTTAQLAKVPGATLVTAVDTAPGTNGIAGSNQTTLEIILSVGACALLPLILIFIGTATIHFLARERDALVASRPGATRPRVTRASSRIGRWRNCRAEISAAPVPLSGDGAALEPGGTGKR